MLKNIITGIFALSTIQCAFATTNLGAGHINVGETAKIDLAKLQSGAFYHVYCKLTAEKASSTSPIYLRFDTYGTDISPNIWFDDNMLSYNQQMIKDGDQHKVAYGYVKSSYPEKSFVSIQALEGQASVNPVAYNCYANLVIGAVEN